MCLIIDTSLRSWQKEMVKQMKSGEGFILVTEDQELVNILVYETIHKKTLKNILLGGEAIKPAGGFRIAGLSGAAVFSTVIGLSSVADLEPVSKVLMAIIAAVCTAIGSGSIYFIVSALLKKSYAFGVDKEDFVGGRIKIKAKPSRAVLNYCSDQVGIR